MLELVRSFGQKSKSKSTQEKNDAKAIRDAAASTLQRKRAAEREKIGNLAADEDDQLDEEDIGDIANASASMPKRGKTATFQMVAEKETRKRHELGNQRLQLENERARIAMENNKIEAERERNRTDERRFELEMRESRSHAGIDIPPESRSPVN